MMAMKQIPSLTFLFAGILALITPLFAHADEQEDKKNVTVKIRVIEATGRGADGEQDPDAIEEQDARLGDISKNLSHLEFSKFKLLSEENLTIPMTTKQSVSLGGGHMVTVRPLYVSSGRVGMWIHWEDNKTTLLNTRMHFACKDKVLTGADSDTNSDSAMILAVGAHLVGEE